VAYAPFPSGMIIRNEVCAGPGRTSVTRFGNETRFAIFHPSHDIYMTTSDSYWAVGLYLGMYSFAWLLLPLSFCIWMLSINTIQLSSSSFIVICSRICDNVVIHPSQFLACLPTGYSYWRCIPVDVAFVW